MNGAKAMLARFERWWPALVLGHRWKFLIAALLVVAAAGGGARLLVFDTNYRIFFSDSNPELKTLDSFEDTYTQPDNILIVVQPPDGDVFTPKTLGLIEHLSEEAWKIPHAIRVDSITNFQNTWSDGDTLVVEDLVSGAGRLSTDELAGKRERALSEPLLNGSLIPPDAHVTGVNVTIQYPMQSSNEVPETVAYARKLVADLQASYPDYRFALSGLIMLNNAFAETGQKDMQTLVPVMYGVLIAATVLLLRSFVPSLVTLLIIALSTAVAMGAAGYLGIRLSPISATAPTIILTLAVADSLHILVPFLVDMRRGTAKKEALEKSLRINLVPISVTSLTTAIGFLTLNFAESPVFWHLGNISAIGILAGWLLSLTLLPALISLLPIRVKVREGRPDGVGRTLSSVATHMARHRRVVLGTAAVSVLVLVSIAPHMRLDDNFVKYFDHDIEFRRDTDYMLNNLTGIIRLEYSMPGAPGKGVNDPAYLEVLDAFTQWLRSQDLVRHVYSYTDIVKRINMNMHGDDPDAYAVPENQALAAQYLLLYELSLPYGLSLNDRIALDRSASRVTVTMDDVSMYEVREFRRRAAEWMQANMPEAYRGQATGVAVMFSYISQRNIEGMLVGNAIGLVAISFLLLLMLRSLRLGVISLITNLVPIAVSFGIWALLVGEIGMAAASVAAIALGIIVDDTVHFLIKYLRARNEGMDDMEAVGYAAGTVGKAIMVITVVTIAGFVVLALSSFRINVQMGLLTAMTLSLGALFSFTVMPALLTIGYKARKETKDVEEAILEGGVRKLDLPPVSAADFDRAGSVGRSS